MAAPAKSLRRRPKRRQTRVGRKRTADTSGNNTARLCAPAPSRNRRPTTGRHPSAHHLVRQTIRVARRAGGVRCEGLAEPSHLSEQPDLGPEAGEGLRSRPPPGAGPPRRRCAASRTAAFVLPLHVMQSQSMRLNRSEGHDIRYLREPSWRMPALPASWRGS